MNRFAHNNEISSIYVSGSGTTAVQVQAGSDPLRVTGSVSSDTPVLTRSVDPDEFGASLASFARDHELHHRRIILTIPTEIGYLRHMRMPFSEEDQIRSTAPFQLEEYIQPQAIEDMEVDLDILDQTQNGSRVLAGAMSRSLLEEIIESISSRGLDVISIQFDLISCFNILQRTGCFSNHPDGWIVYLDPHSVSLMLVNERLPAEIRDFQMIPQNEIGTTETDAPEKDHDRNIDRHEKMQSSDQYVNRLEQEIEKTMLSSGLLEAPEQLVLMGDPPSSISKDELNEKLERSFDVLTPFSPDFQSNIQFLRSGEEEDASTSNSEKQEEAPSDDSSEQEQDQSESSSGDDGRTQNHLKVELKTELRPEDIPVPLGSLPYFQEEGSCAIEFRKGSYAYQNLWDTVRMPVFFLSVSLLITSLVFLFTSQSRYNRWKHTYREFVNQQEQEFRTLYPDGPPRATRSIPDLLRRKLTSEEKRIGKGLPIKTSALQYWHHIFREVTVRGDISINSLRLQLSSGGGGQLNIEGRSANRELAVTFKNRILESSFINQPRTNISRDGEGDGFRFQLQFTITNPPRRSDSESS